MPRFFVNRDDIHDKTIRIYGEEMHHLKRVLRVKVGERLTLCDGLQHDYEVLVEKIEEDCIETTILKRDENQTEAPIRITLYQGIPKSEKMESIIKKSVEIGVVEIVPVLTINTVVKLKNKNDIDKKTERWQKIANEAAKQCLRGIIPKVHMPISFKDAITKAKETELSLIPYEKEKEISINKVLENRNIKTISVFIGPEGGFSLEEIHFAISQGSLPITLGPRILRTETAGIVVLSVIMNRLGDMC